jgi:predicted amidophosphoribosyltransferase
MPNSLLRWLAVAGDLLLGAACPGCDAPGLGLCADCRFELAAPEPHPSLPTPFPPGFPETVAGGPYDELLATLISAHKERQAWLLTGVLADRLARSVESLLRSAPSAGRPVVLVPVPSSPSAVRSRGRDATAAIAAGTARRLRRASARPVTVIKLLRPVRRLADQSGLSEDERRRNLAGAFVVANLRTKPVPAAGLVVLVDDLVTTGSSLTEARRALTAAGYRVLGAAAIAATVRRGPPGRHRPPTRVLDRDR